MMLVLTQVLEKEFGWVHGRPLIHFTTVGVTSALLVCGKIAISMLVWYL